ncbi:FAH family protein [Inquilinus sp. KBS0705]|nr:FAH family protein [Inquilinus sp. KBS0705]
MRLIQFLDVDGNKKTGKVEGKNIRVLEKITSVYDLFDYAEAHHSDIISSVETLLSDVSVDYDWLDMEGKILLPVDHKDPYHTWITGTGLTHMGSADSRNKMHQGPEDDTNNTISDSLKMFQAGLQNGKLIDGRPGEQPEWFFKGNGLTVSLPGKDLPMPEFALDGGEEPEIGAVYIINNKGIPKRIGFVLGNEFSDHQMEKQNYLNLAHSKLRYCSYGPEILLTDLPSNIMGQSKIIRNNEIVWEKAFSTGEDNMSHNLLNIQHHHFKYNLFRQPGDLHIHFLGTSVLSYTDNFKTKVNDIFHIESAVMGKPLINRLVVS